MPAPNFPLPASLPTLHLYRHLLREASYLPPAFQSRIKLAIHARFNRHQFNDVRLIALLAKGRKALRTLRAANSGDRRTMEILISKGFGRSGPRRRRLLSDFVKPEAASDSKALESLLDEPAEPTASKKTEGQEAGPGSIATNTSAHKATASASEEKPKLHKNAFFERWDQKKLKTILSSQRAQQGETKKTTSWPTSALRSTNDNQYVPEKNTWGNPPANFLVRTKKAHWWRRSIDKIMPPLGSGEWDLLRRLSNGAQDQGEWKVPSRRPLARQVSADDTEKTYVAHWDGYATKSADRMEETKSFRHQRRTGQRDLGPYGVRDRTRSLSARWFRRAYNRTWQTTPKMKQDPNTLKYSFEWGSTPSRVPAATSAQLELFEGVDNKGEIPKKQRVP